MLLTVARVVAVVGIVLVIVCVPPTPPDPVPLGPPVATPTLPAGAAPVSIAELLANPEAHRERLVVLDRVRAYGVAIPACVHHPGSLVVSMGLSTPDAPDEGLKAGRGPGLAYPPGFGDDARPRTYTVVGRLRRYVGPIGCAGSPETVDMRYLEVVLIRQAAPTEQEALVARARSLVCPCWLPPAKRSGP